MSDLWNIRKRSNFNKFYKDFFTVEMTIIMLKIPSLFVNKITTFYKLSASDILSFAALHICCYQNDLTRQALFMEDLLQKREIHACE